MKVAVIGSREFKDYSLLVQFLDKKKISKIISGGARGADSLAVQYAKENDIELLEFLPDYKKHGRGAPLIRNKLIVDASDQVVAFWNGESRGTKYTIDYAKKIGKGVEVVTCI